MAADETGPYLTARCWPGRPAAHNQCISSERLNNVCRRHTKTRSRRTQPRRRWITDLSIDRVGTALIDRRQLEADCPESAPTVAEPAGTPKIFWNRRTELDVRFYRMEALVMRLEGRLFQLSLNQRRVATGHSSQWKTTCYVHDRELCATEDIGWKPRRTLPSRRVLLYAT